MTTTPQALAERRQQLLQEYERQAESVSRLLSELEHLDRLTQSEIVEEPEPVKAARPRATGPNPQALAALDARLLWWIAKTEAEKLEAKKAKRAKRTRRALAAQA